MMAKRRESLPRPEKELEDLAAHYDNHDTAGEMHDGEWVDPRPMKTTSLRLPAEVVETLKALAQAKGVRYTTLLREIIERAVRDAPSAEANDLAEINQRLAHIEALVALHDVGKKSEAFARSRRTAASSGDEQPTPARRQRPHSRSRAAHQPTRQAG